MDKKYEAQTHEARIQALWENQKTFKAQPDSQKPLFSIDTPPPTVSGSLHIGHIFSYTQTDIIARFKRLCGFNVFYPFGFDDNGLATERFVEKKHKISGHAMGRTDFVKLCLKESHESEKQFETLWKQMGISADWTQTYSTISPLAQKISQRSFIDLYEKGYIYRKEDPALYCTTCRTAVAQAELDDADMASTFNDIVFETATGKDGVISTTRPELLPSCVALLYHPDDARYKHLAGTTARVPLFNHEVPVLADELVQPDKGTGLVMCCTFGDKNDIAWYKKHRLPYRPSVGLDGVWIKETGILAGLKAHAARERILEALKERGLLITQKQITHAVNVHERCKKEIEFVVLTQWFLNILDHKPLFLNALDKVTWYPEFMKIRCKDWIQNLQWDWCLSRQRFYGIPFPIWHCTTCKHVIVADRSKLPLDPQEQSYTGTCPSCNGTSFVPDTDVMDTWNTSSLTPYICAALYNKDVDPFENSDFFPMGMRPQAHDIIRTWAFYTIIKTLLHDKVVPWKDIVISGHVLSKEKSKISKSQGNTPIDPENLLKVHPADVIRYWTASGTLGQDVSFSETQLQIGQRLLTKLWNAFRFIQEHVTAVAPSQELPDKMDITNEWILHQATTCFTRYSKHLEQYEYSLALNNVEQFFWNDFCDNYLELVKDQLFNPDKYDKDTVTATRWTLSQVGLRILQMFAPYIPYITETLYESLYAKALGINSLHLTSFKEVQKPYVYADSAATMDILLHIIVTIRRMKTTKQLSLKTPLTSLTLYDVNQELLKLLVPQETLLKGIIHAQTISYETGDLKEPVLEQDGDSWNAKLGVTVVNN